MDVVKYLLYSASAYRLKFPAHNYHSTHPGQGALDLCIRGLVFLLASLQYENKCDCWWMPLIFSMIPTFPWFIILQATQSGSCVILFTLLSTYGLLQPPWRFSAIYRAQILLLILATIYLYASYFTNLNN